MREHVLIVFVAVLVALLRAGASAADGALPDGFQLGFPKTDSHKLNEGSSEALFIPLNWPATAEFTEFNIIVTFADDETAVSKAKAVEDYDDSVQLITVTESHKILGGVPVHVKLVDDACAEDDETFTLTLMYQPNAEDQEKKQPKFLSSAIITIEDDDDLHIGFDKALYTTYGNWPLTFDVVKRGCLQSHISVDVISKNESETTLLGTVEFRANGKASDQREFKFYPGTNEATYQLRLKLKEPQAARSLIDFGNAVINVTVSPEYELIQSLQSKMTDMKAYIEKLEETLKNNVMEFVNKRLEIFRIDLAGDASQSDTTSNNVPPTNGDTDGDTTNAAGNNTNTNGDTDGDTTNADDDTTNADGNYTNTNGDTTNADGDTTNADGDTTNGDGNNTGDTGGTNDANTNDNDGDNTNKTNSNSYVWVVVVFIAILLAVAAAYVIYHQRTKIKACLADGEKGAKGRKGRYKKLPGTIHDALHQD